jgi:phenylalanyl-tRNA synthetase beta chain
MLELGQPLHAYDIDKVERRLEARFATVGEKLVLLDGKEIELTDDVLVIADASGPVGLAGIMGGQSTAVEAATTSVFLEAAFFTPAAVGGRARRYGLHTDASQRFERGVDPTGQARAIERATELLLKIAGGDAGPLIIAERHADLPKRHQVALRRERLRGVLGLAVADDEVEGVLRRLELKTERTQDGWRVQPPAFRVDITIEEDLIEEVGRMVGYDRIPVVPGMAAERLGQATESHADADRLADALVARGYAEVVTYSFVDAALDAAVSPGTAPVRLANPIASDLAVLRQSPWPSLIGAALENLRHQRARFKLFELGPQFAAAADGGVRETTVLAGLALGARTPEHWDGAAQDIDYFDVKGDVEALLRTTGRATQFRFEPAQHPALSPGRSARILSGDSPVGWLGALHPTLQDRLDRKRSAIVFALELGATFGANVPAFSSYSKFPSIRRDLALVDAEHVSADALIACARAAGERVLQNVVLFDVYRGAGVDSSRKSIGLGLILQDASRTLTDADADQIVRSVTLRLERELGATIRTQQH